MATLCLRVILLFLNTTLKNQSDLTLCVRVRACASMRTDDTAPRRRSRTTTLESLLLPGGFQRSDSSGQAWQQGLYLLSIPQPQLITCLALISNSTQTVSVVQIFQDIHTLFYLRGKISPSLPICFI